MYLNSEKNLISLVKSLSYHELDLMAVEIREKLIDSVSKTGGHLASSLGAVELTLALHRVFNCPEDKIVWDVGHQAYVHKMLTGRLDRMLTLRQHGGISGFPKITESPYDAYDSGHSGTSISAAAGYAKARDLKNDNYSCVAVIGDGALTGGVAYEALNFAGMDNTPLIVVLNDNHMSISPNVGGLEKSLQNLRTSKGYLDFKTNVKKHINNDGKLYNALESARDMLKHAVVPGAIFEELGFKYFGPIDGHNIEEMVRTLETARDYQRPVLVHIITKKGRGYMNAEKHPDKYHGIAPFNPSEPLPITKAEDISYSSVFGRKLTRLAVSDSRIVAVSAAMIEGTGLTEMCERFPDRVFDVGIAEQNAVSFAAGLALNGMKPVVCLYSTFMQRAYDQLVIDSCMQNLPIVFAIDRAGVTGRDGETHQGVFDIAFLRSLPNITILAPKDGQELEAMLEYALSLNSPAAIRYPKENALCLGESERAECAASFVPELLGEDGDYAVLAAGSMVREALHSKEILMTAGYRAAVYNIRCIKPFDKDFASSLLKYKGIVTVEDGTAIGGMGSGFAEFFSCIKDAPPLLILGWPDKFIEHGSVKELRELYGMDGTGIAESCRLFFEKQT